MKSPAKKYGGFSLIEVLVVVSLFMLLSSMFIFGDVLGRSLARDAAENIYSDILLIQNLGGRISDKKDSLLGNCKNARLEFNTQKEQKYRVYLGNEKNNAAREQVIPRQVQMILYSKNASKIQDSLTVEFHDSRWTTGGTIYIGSKYGNYEISIDAISGNTDLIDLGDVKPWEK